MAHSNPCLPSSLGRAVVAAVADAIMLPSVAHAEDYSHQPRSSPHYNPSQLELQHTMLSNPTPPPFQVLGSPEMSSHPVNNIVSGKLSSTTASASPNSKGQVTHEATPSKSCPARWSALRGMLAAS